MICVALVQRKELFFYAFIRLCGAGATEYVGSGHPIAPQQKDHCCGHPPPLSLLYFSLEIPILSPLWYMEKGPCNQSYWCPFTHIFLKFCTVLLRTCESSFFSGRASKVTLVLCPLTLALIVLFWEKGNSRFCVVSHICSREWPQNVGPAKVCEQRELF